MLLSSLHILVLVRKFKLCPNFNPLPAVVEIKVRVGVDRLTYYSPHLHYDIGTWARPGLVEFGSAIRVRLNSCLETADQ